MTNPRLDPDPEPDPAELETIVYPEPETDPTVSIAQPEPEEMQVGVKAALPEKPKVGAPTKYCEEARRAAVALAGLGVGMHTIAGYLGIDPSTLTRWRARYPDFAKEITQAQAACVAGLYAKLVENARRGSVKAITTLLRLKAPQDYARARRIIAGEQATGDEAPGRFMVLQGQGEDPIMVTLEQLEKEGYTVIPPES